MQTKALFHRDSPVLASRYKRSIDPETELLLYTVHTVRYLGILATDLQLTTIFFLSSGRYFLLAVQLLCEGT